MAAVWNWYLAVILVDVTDELLKSIGIKFAKKYFLCVKCYKHSFLFITDKCHYKEIKCYSQKKLNFTANIAQYTCTCLSIQIQVFKKDRR
jgi:hypothetical protein